MYAYTLGMSAKKTYKTYKNNKYKYSITIDSYNEEELYQSALYWLGEKDLNEQSNKYSLVSYWNKGINISGISVDHPTRVMNIGGVNTLVSINSESIKTEDNSSSSTSVDKLCFYFTNQSDMRKTIDTISETLSKRINGEQFNLEMPTMTRYFNYVNGKWDYYSVVPRSLESVILKSGERQKLVNDINKFVELKDEYERIGVPWHRGYLLYGPPGTGKTSVSLGISDFIGLTTFILSLSSIRSDSDLLRAVSTMGDNATVSGGAILVIEDVDTILATNSRDTSVVSGDTKDGVTLGGLLNVLDGALTPNGLLTIITTNYREKLDKALIRPGRIDYELHVDYLDQQQLAGLFGLYFQDDVNQYPVPKLEDNVKITPAEITGIAKNYLGDHDMCYNEIVKYISKKTTATSELNLSESCDVL